ncbi:hypothetical protein [Nonomuraea sp. SYSU D8015]|uniref:hypothetical protein n=1 Tax=Nonomuraea sp. SYSU D8015 TaxID=2593644 RepID=UPI00166155E5|nr:hypothetical protein [Nonomuraea sp. SYSU D8015]
MVRYHKGFVSVDSDHERKWFPAEIFDGYGTYAARKARFDRETTLRIIAESNQTWANYGFRDSLTMNPDGTVTVSIDGTTEIVAPDDDGMYPLNPWGWEEVIPVTLVATFVIPGHNTIAIGKAVKRVLDEHQAKLIQPFDWAPDRDAIADNIESKPFGRVHLADLNDRVDKDGQYV